MKAWNCSWPIIFTFPKVSAAARPAISFVSLDSHIHAFFLKWGCQAFLFRGQERGHPWRKRSAHLVSDHDDVCPLASHNVGGHLSSFYGPGNFWPGNHPTQQGTWIVSDADCSTISFDQCVVLFMRLVDWIEENTLFVFGTVKLLALNSLATPGCFIGSAIMSLLC